MGTITDLYKQNINKVQVKKPQLQGGKEQNGFSDVLGKISQCAGILGIIMQMIVSMMQNFNKESKAKLGVTPNLFANNMQIDAEKLKQLGINTSTLQNATATLITKQPSSLEEMTKAESIISKLAGTTRPTLTMTKQNYSQYKTAKATGTAYKGESLTAGAVNGHLKLFFPFETINFGWESPKLPREFIIETNMVHIPQSGDLVGQPQFGPLTTATFITESDITNLGKVRNADQPGLAVMIWNYNTNLKLVVDGSTKAVYKQPSISPRTAIPDNWNTGDFTGTSNVSGFTYHCELLSFLQRCCVGTTIFNEVTQMCLDAQLQDIVGIIPKVFKKMLGLPKSEMIFRYSTTNVVANDYSWMMPHGIYPVLGSVVGNYNAIWWSILRFGQQNASMYLIHE